MVESVQLRLYAPLARQSETPFDQRRQFDGVDRLGPRKSARQSGRPTC